MRGIPLSRYRQQSEEFVWQLERKRVNVVSVPLLIWRSPQEIFLPVQAGAKRCVSSKIARPKRIRSPCSSANIADSECAILKRCFPSISVHYKTSSLAKVDAQPRQGPGSLRSILERPVRSNGVLGEALANLRHGYDSENQATRDLLDQKAKDYKNVLKEARQPIAASTVDRPKRKRKRKPSN